MNLIPRHFTWIALVVLAVTALPGTALAQPTPTPTITAPVPTVPEIFTMMGQYVRLAYNNEGYVILGYRVANDSVGEDWMLLDLGLTVRKGAKDQVLKRDAFSVKTPDGTMIPLATQKEYAEAGHLAALNARAKVVRDSLAYFPLEVTRAGALRFFADLGSKGNTLSFDEFEVAPSIGYGGRLFFKIPGKIQTGQHWLVVQFAESRVEVPFRIFTPEEAKFAKKNWESFKKEFDAKMGLK